MMNEQDRAYSNVPKPLQKLQGKIKLLVQAKAKLFEWAIGNKDKLYRVAAGVFLFFFLAILWMFIVPKLQDSMHLIIIDNLNYEKSKHHDMPLEKIVAKKLAEKKQLETKLASFVPNTPFLVVNTTQNRFVLYRNKKPVREGICSTGSMTLLEKSDNEKWIFRTPKGNLRVLGKKTSPVWVKPDWAFVEDGIPIPPSNHRSRYEPGVLGDYALSLGDGYMIHGTLYQRFLGLPVTHGCIRLNDEDLEHVYMSLNVGSRVFIY